jgi:lipid-A-disaccharide synthase-like uncharacterized protein
MEIAKLTAGFAHWWAATSWAELAWLTFGLAAQSMFAMRFVVQWVASERVKRSVVPETFWYFSLAGGVGLLLYAVHKADPVFMLGQGTGLFIYSRNIYFIWLQKKSERAAPALEAAE